MNKLCHIIGIFVLFSGFASGQDSIRIQQLEERLKQVEEKLKKSELENLLKEAENVSLEKKQERKSKIFNSGQLSLQAINPEISLAGDAFANYLAEDDHFNEENRTGAYFRVLGLHVQSNLDPFSMAKIAVEFTPGRVELGEAYLTWSRVLPNISLTAGKFRQQFGVVNRWHEHALDQFGFPLALTTILGEEGLNQTGISVNWLMPSFLGHSNSLTVEITNGENEHLFAGENFSFPAVLGRLSSYYDLTSSTYLDVGFTGMIGRNNIEGYVDGRRIMESTRYTKLGGFDMTLLWEPVNRSHYRNFLWRSELFFAEKEENPRGNIKAWGGYSYGQLKFSERWEVGLRLDYTLPFVRNNKNLYLYQVVPYLTWWQSHWVKMRLELDHLYDKETDESSNQIKLQVIWAVGPHKHDRY